MKDSEIVKALECCKQTCLPHCQNCAYWKINRCSKILKKDALDLINRLQADNENYSKNNKQMTSDILKLYKGLEQAKAELEEYQKIKTTIDEFWKVLLTLSLCKRKEKPTLEEFAEAIQEIKAEAVTEFADRLKEKADKLKHVSVDSKWAISQYDIDNLLKELVGE